MNEHVKQAEAEEKATNEKPAMPETLAAAVCQVMSKIKRLSKGSQNSHGGYDFTSVDDFKDALRPLMSEAGLYLHVSQESFQMIDYVDGKGNNKSVAQYHFSITLAHVNGDKSEPEMMTVALPFTGAQTSGAARSYAVKEWSKSRFLMSSGDMGDEADLLEQSRDGMRLSKAEARDLYTALTEEIRKVINGRDHEALGKWWMDNKYRIETLPKDWYIQFRTDYATSYKELKANEELDKMTNAELDAKALEQEGAE